MNAISEQEHSKQLGVLRTASWVTLILLLSKVMGFLRESLLAWFFGISVPIDALTIASGVSNTIFGVFTVTIGITAMPLYTELKLNRGSAKAQSFLDNLGTILLLGVLVLSVICWCGANYIVMAFAPGFVGDSRFDLCVTMFRMLTMTSFFQIASGIFTTYLQSERRMAQIVLTSATGNLASISAIIVAHYTSQPLWLAIGAIGAIALPAVLLYMTCRRYRYTWKFAFDLHDPSIQAVARMMVPVWAGQVLGIIGVMIDRSVATMLFPGAAGIIDYANKLLGSLSGLIIPTMNMYILPYLAESAVVSREKLIANFGTAIRYALVLIVPLTIGAVAVAESTVRVIYGYGQFGEYEIMQTALVMRFYAPAVFILSAVDGIVYRIFTILRDTKTPFWAGTVGTLVNIILNLVLSRYIGIAGLAIATSISIVVALVWKVVIMRLRLGAIGGKSILTSALWSLCASLVMVLPIYAIQYSLFPMFVLRWQRVLLMLCQVAIGALIYGFIMLRSPLEEVASMKNLIWAQAKSMWQRLQRT